MGTLTEDFAALRFTGPGDQLLAAATRLARAPQPEPGTSERALWHEARAHVAAADSYNSPAAEDLARAVDVYRGLGHSIEVASIRVSQLAAEVNASRTDVITSKALTTQMTDEIAELRRLDASSAVVAEAQITLAFSLITAAQLSAVDPVLAEAETLAGQSPYYRVRIIGARALLAGQQGHGDEAIRLARQSREIAESAGDRLQAATMAQYLIGLLSRVPDFPGALAAAELAMVDAPDLNDLLHAMVLRLRGTLRIALERPAEGAADLRVALDLAEKHPGSDLQMIGPLSFALAQQLAQAGEYAALYALIREHEHDVRRLTADELTATLRLYYLACRATGREQQAADVITEIAQSLADAHHYPAASEAFREASEAWSRASDDERSRAAATTARDLAHKADDQRRAR